MSNPTEASVQLLRRYKNGDEGALCELLERQIQPMRRWARGRLPRWARDEMNTDDLVQDALMRTMSRLEGFEPRHDGALQASCVGRFSIASATKSAVRTARVLDFR